MEIKHFELAYQLNTGYKDLLKTYQVHFRANLNSMSLISLSSDKPELGVKCNLGKYTSSGDLQSLILQDIERKNRIPCPKRPTPEKELQSWIINYALNHDNRMPFDDDIKFITSELAIFTNTGKKVVTDILAYDNNKNHLFIIELKSDRLLNRLIEQVNEFEKVIIEKPEFFDQLLDIHGYRSPLSFSNIIKKVIVWPHGITSPKEKLQRKDIKEITYQGHYTFFNHS
jgi:hypothetical protein